MQTHATSQGRSLSALGEIAVLIGLALVLTSPYVMADTPPRSAPSVFEGILADDDDVPEVSSAGLRAALTDPRVIVFDARPYEEYAVSHIPGAHNVRGKPGLLPSQFTSDTSEVLRMLPDRAQPVVVYCNGLFCGRSKRFASELRAAGYTDVRRYQLGIPAWRALGGATQIEASALVDLLRRDATAVLVDARARTMGAAPLPKARSIPLSETTQAKDDGRLPMTDHNTRIFVVGSDGIEARAVAEAIVRDAFHNVSFYDGEASGLAPLLHPCEEPGEW